MHNKYNKPKSGFILPSIFLKNFLPNLICVIKKLSIGWYFNRVCMCVSVSFFRLFLFFAFSLCMRIYQLCFASLWHNVKRAIKQHALKSNYVWNKWRRMLHTPKTLVRPFTWKSLTILTAKEHGWGGCSNCNSSLEKCSTGNPQE